MPCDGSGDEVIKVTCDDCGGLGTERCRGCRGSGQVMDHDNDEWETCGSQPFGITIVDPRTGIVKANLIKNLNESQQKSLPKGSIYEPTRQAVEKAMRQDGFEDQGMPAQKWAKLVVQDLLKKNPPSVIWREGIGVVDSACGGFAFWHV